jgi:competence protein ComEC
MPARSPGGFDEETWARRARIDGFGSCKSPRLVTVVETADRSDMPAVRRLRRWIGERFAQVEGDAARAVALSMVLGDESNLPPETKDAFRASGLLHLLVVSGAQVMLLLAILRRVLPRRFRTLWRGFWIEGAVLALYGFITGGESSIARACVMAVALGLAARLDLGRHPGDGPESRGRDLSGLSLAVLVLLSVRPQDSLDTGAQLSFAAAFALVRFSPVATARLGAIGVPAVIAETAVATTLAGLATAPVLIGEFQRLPLAGFVTNLAAAPFAAILLVLSWAFVPVEPVLSAAGAAFPVEWALSALAKCLIFIAQTGAGTGLEWRTPGPGWFVWSAIVALVIGNRRRTLRRAMIAVLFAGGLTESGRRAGDGRLHVHVIDVGQGDAILVVAPDGRAGLVDAGPAFPGYDAGDRVVTPSLWAAGVSRLEFLALSHPHADHQGGAAAVARHLRPRRGVLGPGHAIPSPGDWMSVAAGNAFDLGAVRFRVLSPRGAEGARERDANARSLVFDVEWAGLSVLLLGDATEAIESRLALRGSALLVKVAHHGARRSSSKSLVEVARPLYAAVSVGRGNRFSHPDPTVLARWREVDSRIHRTDWEGSLRLATDGIRIWQATGAEPLLRPIQAAIRLDIRSGAGRRP